MCNHEYGDKEIRISEETSLECDIVVTVCIHCGHVDVSPLTNELFDEAEEAFYNKYSK